jgi:phosphatidate cytidylyltransferase
MLVTSGAMLELFPLVLAGTTTWFRVAALGVGLTLPLATYWEGVLGLTLATVIMLFIALLAHLFLYAEHEAVLPSLGATVFAQLYVPFLLSHLLLLVQLPSGRRWIFFVLFVIFAGDTGAYYVGHRWGRRKLWPSVSPGKTVAGAVGGLFASLVIALIAGKLLLSSSGIGLGFLLILAFALALVGQMGDLIESMLKRVSQVKDAGGLLPGHGGLLDRLDSLIFAFPLTFYGVALFA